MAFESFILVVQEILIVLFVAAAFEAVSFCPSLWPPAPQPEATLNHDASPKTQCSKNVTPPEVSRPSTKEKVPQRKKKAAAKPDQPAHGERPAKKEQLLKESKRPQKKSKSSKKSQLSTQAQPETSYELTTTGPVVPSSVFGPELPPVASRGREPFSGGIIIESHKAARAYATAPPYENDRMIFYTDGSFEGTGDAKSRRAGAAVVHKKTSSDRVWIVRAFHMRFDHCFWAIHDIETWALAAALETAWSLNNHSREIKIFTDSKASLHRISDAKKPGYRFLSSMPGLEAFLHYAALLADAGVEVTLQWCPAHDGVPGNEVADEFSRTGRLYDSDSSSGVTSRSRPIEFTSTAKHPNVQELIIPQPVPDFTRAPTIPGQIVAKPRPRRGGPLSTSLNPDNKSQELITITAAIEKLTQNQAMLVQMLSSKVQYDVPIIPAIQAQNAFSESVKPIGLIEAPPDTDSSESPTPTVELMKRRPAMPLHMSGSRVNILGLKGFMPIAGPEHEHISFSSSEEEPRRDSPRFHEYDSEPDSDMSLDTVATSVGEYGAGEVHGEAQKDDDSSEHPDLGPDIPMGQQWVETPRSNYLREHFPWVK